MSLSTRISLIAGAVILLVAFVTIWQLPANILTVIGVGIGFSVVIFALAVVTYFCLIGWQKLQQERNNTLLSNLKARVITNEHGTWVMQRQLADKTLDLTALHSNPQWQINGHREPTTQAELLSWQAYNGRGAKILPELSSGMVVEVAKEQDLLTIINNYPHTHFWGGTGDGKSSILRTVGFSRRELGHQVYVLDSNDHPAMWDGLERINDVQEQDDFIASALSLHKINSEALATGRAVESDFDQITILSNEWTDIVRRTEAAALFIDEMSRKSRKSGFHCVFATQTKLATDLGLDGRYQVIRNFVQIELFKNPTGVYMARAVYGGNKLGEFLVPIPPAKPAMLSSGYIPPSIREVSPDLVLDKKTSDKDMRIIEMIQNGASDGEIAQECFGRSNLVGGNFYKVKELRQRFTTT